MAKSKSKRAPKAPKMSKGENGHAVLVRMSGPQHAALKSLAAAAGLSCAKYLLRAVDRAGKIAPEDRRPGVGRPSEGE